MVRGSILAGGRDGLHRAHRSTRYADDATVRGTLKGLADSTRTAHRATTDARVPPAVDAHTSIRDHRPRIARPTRERRAILVALARDRIVRSRRARVRPIATRPGKTRRDDNSTNRPLTTAEPPHHRPRSVPRRFRTDRRSPTPHRAVPPSAPPRSASLSGDPPRAAPRPSPPPPRPRRSTRTPAASSSSSPAARSL